MDFDLDFDLDFVLDFELDGPELRGVGRTGISTGGPEREPSGIAKHTRVCCIIGALRGVCRSTVCF